jgi:uncharacterized protein
MTLDQAIDASGFEHKDRLIHLFPGGSALHGATGTGPSDLDVYGLFVEPMESLLGLEKYEHFVWSTSGDNTRNTPDDVDVTLYSLRRWAGLAAKGNPTALSFLWANNALGNNTLWDYFRKNARQHLVCKRSVNAFRGFVTDQMKRLLGEKGQGKHGQRPDLTSTHGYDTKAAMHAARLCFEGIELMQTGNITYPNVQVEQLKNIRAGKYSLDQVSQFVSGLLFGLDDAERMSTLPEKPNFKELNYVLCTAHMGVLTEGM